MVDRVACRGLVIRDGKLLVVKLRPDDNWYCLPGGTLEAYEELDSCIRREIKEELGGSPMLGAISYIHEIVIDNEIHVIEFFYKIENVKDFDNINLANNSHGFEISEIKWLDIFDEETIFLPKGLMDKLRQNNGKLPDFTQIITSK